MEQKYVALVFYLRYFQKIWRKWVHYGKSFVEELRVHLEKKKAQTDSFIIHAN
jgi:hypothetical protein